jgi:hypothetical protein
MKEVRQKYEIGPRLPGMLRQIEEGREAVESWVERHKYLGYEPFDGLSSYLRKFTFGNLFAERLLQQLVRQSPFNLRPILGIKPMESTKGRGFMAWGYITRYRSSGNTIYRDKALAALNWLNLNRSAVYRDHSWGNHFDFSSRAGRLPRLEPIIVWSSFIGQAFLDAYEVLRHSEWLTIARSICEWILGLPREKTPSGDCLSYFGFRQASVHNSNMLGAALLARTAKFTGETFMLDVARAAMRYSCSRQRDDGSWWYSEDKDFHWIDNFHTGYNLDSLHGYIESSGDTSFSQNLAAGFEFYKNSFFRKDGAPRYYHNRLYPIDIQCAAQAIDTLALFSEDDECSLSLATNVARWTLKNMQAPAGYFYYRLYPVGKCKTPMLHWGQATMYKSLCHLIFCLDRGRDGMYRHLSNGDRTSN